MSRQVKMRRKCRAAQGQVPFENNEVMNITLESSHANVMAGITTHHYQVIFFPSLLCSFFFPKFMPFQGLLQAERKRRGKVNVKYYYLKHIHRHNKALK